jgi:hypothetical protein
MFICLFIYLFIYCGTGVRTQGLALARQALHHFILAPSPSVFSLKRPTLQINAHTNIGLNTNIDLMLIDS